MNDFFVFNIDIDNLSNDDKYQIKLICDCLNTRIVCGNIQENGNWQIKELTENDVFYVNNYISCSKNYYVKAKLNHLLFFKTTEKNRIIYARNAIDSYIIAYQNSINSDYIWINASQIYNNLVDLAFKINYQKNAVLQISINNIKKSKEWGIIKESLDFLIEKVKKKKYKKVVLNGCINICKRQIKNPQNNITIIENFISLGMEISKIKNGNLVQWDILQARAYENEIKNALLIENNEMVAASWCKDAIKYYKRAKLKNKANNLYIKYKKLSSKMQLATFESDAYDLKNEIENLYKFIDSHSSTGILNFLIYGFIPNYKHNIKRAEQMQNESVISCLVSTTYTDLYGQIVGYANTEEENLRKNLWQEYCFGLQFRSILVDKYLQYAIEKNKLNSEFIIEFLNKTWLGTVFKKKLPGNQILIYQWLSHIKDPIISYFNKKQKIFDNKYFAPSFIMEVDCLALKIEGILRDIVDIANLKDFQVRKFVNNEQGQPISVWKTINELLWDKNIFQILPENDIWFMRFYLVDYYNLRNDVAHSLILSQHQEQYYYGCLWLLIIILRLSQCLQITENRQK